MIVALFLSQRSGCTLPNHNSPVPTVRFDAPVGTEKERNEGKWPPGQWTDANPFGRSYFLGLHTGSDLNLNEPTWDLDRFSPVFSVADGVVTFTGRLPDWGNVVIIRHLLEDGTLCYSRYGHIENIVVRTGQTVTRGQQIGVIGRARENSAYHLHIDFARTSILERDPGHWPGWSKSLLQEHYIDPKVFIEARHTVYGVQE